MSQALQFTKAVKRKAKLRIGLVGPSGSGKTYTALRIAKGLGGKVAVIDTEHGSASLYADQFEFDVLELTSFGPDTYSDAITAAVNAGYDVVIIDSLSHAWMGKDGALEQVDKAAARSQGNSFAAWRTVTPKHNRMIDTITAAGAHLIATMRSKTEYVIEEDSRGKKVPKKIGLAPVQRDGMEYEFTVVGDMDHEHRWCVTKSRVSVLADAVIEKPGEDVAKTLLDWLENAEPELPKPAPAPSTNGARPEPREEVEREPLASHGQVELLGSLVKSHVFTDKERQAVLEEIANGLTRDRARQLIDDANTTLRRRKEKEKHEQKPEPEPVAAPVAAGGPDEQDLPF